MFRDKRGTISPSNKHRALLGVPAMHRHTGALGSCCAVRPGGGRCAQHRITHRLGENRGEELMKLVCGPLLPGQMLYRTERESPKCLWAGSAEGDKPLSSKMSTLLEL